MPKPIIILAIIAALLGIGAYLYMNNFTLRTDDPAKTLRKDIGKTVTYSGTARDAEAGAVLAIGGGTVAVDLSMEGMSSWPKEYLRKRVRVTGTLAYKKYIPSPITDSNGVVSQGAEGMQYVLENPHDIKLEKEQDVIVQTTIVTITSGSARPVSAADSLVLGNAEGPEFVVMVINGVVKNLVWAEVSFDGETLREERIIEKVPRFSDQTIVIGTSIPEGVPSEMLTWESVSGKKYSFVMSYDGMTGSISREFELE